MERLESNVQWAEPSTAGITSGRTARRTRFRPLERWRVVWLVCIWLGIYLPAIFATMSMIRIVFNPYDAPRPTAAELMEGAAGYEGIVVLTLVVQVLPLAVWLVRAYANLDAFGVRPLRPRPWMVALSWVVPILNVAVAARALGDSWRGAGPAASSNPAWRSLRVPRGITVWWLSFCAVGFGVFVFALSAPPSHVDHVAIQHYLAYAALLLLVVVCRVGGHVMKAVGERQRRHAVALQLILARPDDQAPAEVSTTDTTDEGAGFGWAMLLEAIIGDGFGDGDGDGDGDDDDGGDFDFDAD